MTLEQLDRLKINVESPARVVSATLADGATVRVALRSEAARLTDAALAAEAQAALRALIRGYDKTVDEILTRARDGRPAPDPRGTRIGQLREWMDQAIADIDVAELSERKCVKVRWRGNDDLMLRIRPGSMNQIGVTAMEAELNSGLNAVLRARSTRVREAELLVYGDPELERAEWLLS